MVNEKDLKPISYKTYEQFILEEPTEQEQKIADSYQAEFDARGDISVPKSYGPSPEQYYSDSSGNYVKVTVSSSSRGDSFMRRRAWADGNSWGYLFMRGSRIYGYSSMWLDVQLEEEKKSRNNYRDHKVEWWEGYNAGKSDYMYEEHGTGSKSSNPY